MRGAELLLQSSVSLVAPRGVYPVQDGEIPFSALRDLPLVLPTQPNKLVATVTDIATRQRFALRVIFEASTGALVRDAVEQTGLCTLVPLHQAQRDYAAGNFTVARIIKPVIQQKAWLVLSTQRPASRAARVVARLVRELAGHIVSNGQPVQK
jgi:LysR family nitrogen assimilation transcriptional regulator